MTKFEQKGNTIKLHKSMQKDINLKRILNNLALVGIIFLFAKNEIKFILSFINLLNHFIAKSEII